MFKTFDIAMFASLEGLDGWFQMRCPLAIYGCTYTVQKFVTNNDRNIVYNPVVECFSTAYYAGKILFDSDNDDVQTMPNLGNGSCCYLMVENHNQVVETPKSTCSFHNDFLLD